MQRSGSVTVDVRPRLLPDAVAAPPAAPSPLPTAITAPSEDIWQRLCASATGVHDLILHQALLRPDAAAIIDADGTTHTYRALLAAALAVSRHLTAAPSHDAPEGGAGGAGLGLQRGSIVALHLPRGFHLVTSLLGIMHAGCTYVYLDPAYPEAHQRLVIEDSGAALLISSTSTANPLEAQLVPTLAVEAVMAEAAALSAGPACATPLPQLCGNTTADMNISSSAGATSISSSAGATSISSSASAGSPLLAILYTSGSTGRPKGVTVTHAAALASFMLEPWEGVTHQDTFAQTSSAGFIASMHDLWLPLARGATVITIPRDTLLDAPMFAKAIADYHITCAFLTPRVLELYADSAPATLDGLDRVWLVGEAARPDAVAAMAARAGAPKIWHLYGCTEHCGCIAGYPVPRSSGSASPAAAATALAALAAAARVPVGTPTHGARVLLMPTNTSPSQLVPVTTPGATGEVWVTSPQVSSGYWRLPEATTERFITLGGERYYRTGDLGNWVVPPGEEEEEEEESAAAAAGAEVADADTGRPLVLELLGRSTADSGTVKVSGNRVELGAIEAAALAAAGGDLAAAVASLWAGSQLALYYVAAPGKQAPNGRQLRKGLVELLPPYMVPHYYTPIDAVPLNANGKIDRASLPPPAASTVALAAAAAAGARRAAVAAADAPLGSLAAGIAAAMEEVLSLPPGSVGASDSYTLDLGGNSLSLFALLPRMRALAPDVAIDATNMMDAVSDSPGDLAARIEGLRAEQQAAAATPAADAAAGAGAGAGAAAATATNPIPVVHSTGQLPEELEVVYPGSSADGSDKAAPFYVIHSGMGLFPCGGNMARAMAAHAHRPLLAVQLTAAAAAAVAAAPTPAGRIPALAAWYADSIQVVQPAGPYYLSGMGRGGIIAYEVGRELESRGHQVGAVLAIDFFANSHYLTRSLGGKDIVAPHTYVHMAEVALAAGRAPGVTEADAAARMAALDSTLRVTEDAGAHMAAFEGFLRTNVAPGIAEHVMRGITTMSATWSWDPLGRTGGESRTPGAPLLAAPVVACKATLCDTMADIARRCGVDCEVLTDYGWSELSQGPVPMYDIEATHADCLDCPKGTEFISKLMASL